MKTDGRPFVVVGAGIGGMAVAAALAQRGHRVLILEQAAELGEIGAGIQLAPNALRVLDGLGVLDDVVAKAVRPRAATMRDATTGEVLTRLDFDASFVERFGYAYLVTHRSDLHRSLVDATQATGVAEIRTDSRVVTVAEDADGVVIVLESGERLEARALIGADGLHSVVRKYLIGNDEVVHNGDFAYRGTVPYEDVKGRVGSDEITWWVGKDMHLIQYPVRGGELVNQVGVFRSDPNVKGSVVDGGDPTDFDRLIADKHPLVLEGAARLERHRVWPIVDRESVTRWVSGPVAVVGDAAHPMVQYLAQGACQALEDVACLVACVEKFDDVAEAFEAYETRRAPVAATVQRWARTMGQIVHAGGITADLRNALFKTLCAIASPQLEWLYGDHSDPLTVD